MQDLQTQLTDQKLALQLFIDQSAQNDRAYEDSVKIQADQYAQRKATFTKNINFYTDIVSKTQAQIDALNAPVAPTDPTPADTTPTDPTTTTNNG